jgi:hypothetical protein
MELTELLNEREWRACRGPSDASIDQLVEAFAYFCENHWAIKHPERGRIMFELREASECVQSRVQASARKSTTPPRDNHGTNRTAQRAGMAGLPRPV